MAKKTFKSLVTKKEPSGPSKKDIETKEERKAAQKAAHLKARGL